MLKPNRFTQHSFIAIAAISILLFRAVLMIVIPLMDKTEARYAEIARLMFETQNWVVLSIDYGMPFWAKPPLSTWLTAASFGLFGVEEWAARLPAFLLSLAIIALLFHTVKRVRLSLYFLAFVLMTTPQFLLHAGVVSTDTTFNFCVVVVMLCFWNSQITIKSRLWGYGFFIFMGLGILAKGPIMLVLTVPPLVIWSLLQKQSSSLILRALPWVPGIFLTCLIAIPWYILMENQSPGFLNYFIVGEHLGRFLQSGWHGDLYGFAKAQPIGTIWLFLFIAAFPWVQLVCYWLWKNRAEIKYSAWIMFLTIWMLWTPFFFTFSRNISHTYVIPVLAPIALLSCFAWNGVSNKRALAAISLIFPSGLLITFLVAFVPGRLDYYLNSDKYLLEPTHRKEETVFYWKQKPYSAQFYTSGKAKVLTSEEELHQLSNSSGCFFLMVPKSERAIVEGTGLKLQLLKQNRQRLLFRGSF